MRIQSVVAPTEEGEDLIDAPSISPLQDGLKAGCLGADGGTCTMLLSSRGLHSVPNWFGNTNPIRIGLQTFSGKNYEHLSSSIHNPLSDKEYRRDWAQEAAKNKIRELKGKGMSNVAIGALAGVTGVYIGNILKEEDPKPVSKKVWDALIAHTDFKPSKPTKGRDPGLSDSVSRASEPQVVYGSRAEELLARILKGQEEQAANMRQLNENITLLTKLLGEKLN